MEDRRDKFRKADMALKIVLVLIGVVQAIVGWGLGELYSTLKEHDRAIIIVQEKTSNLDGRLQLLQGGITTRLDRMEGKIDQIIQTGILNPITRGSNRRWKDD